MDKNTAIQVKDSCRELLAARKDGKLTQDQMDYELSKISLEFLEDYRPGKSVNVEDWRKFTDEDFKYLSHKFWLERMYQILSQHDHAQKYSVLEIIRSF